MTIMALMSAGPAIDGTVRLLVDTDLVGQSIDRSLRCRRGHVSILAHIGNEGGPR